MLENTRELEIEWGDCDAAGIVFYPRYFEMFDASTAYLLEKAFSMKKPDWTRKYGIIGIPMVDTGAKFSLASTYGDVIAIRTMVKAIHVSSFEIGHEVLKAGRTAVIGHETRVWTARDPERSERLRSIPLPEEVRTALSGL